MDILVSSNLERLLYMLCGDTATAGYMKQLSAEGKYAVSAETLQKIRSEFSAKYCDDTATKAKIAEVWNKYGYLIDTHTGVAAAALDAYRAETGDNSPTVIVSTASPFKFAADVLSALGDTAEEPLTALSEKCALPIPMPLSGLDQREVRFGGITEKTEMQQVVNGFLK